MDIEAPARALLRSLIAGMAQAAVTFIPLWRFDSF
jgi:hypothetical protein